MSLGLSFRYGKIKAFKVNCYVLDSVGNTISEDPISPKFNLT